MDGKRSQDHRFQTVCLSTLGAIRVIKSKLNPSQLERFKASCFGKLLDISEGMKFSSPIVSFMLSRQVDHGSSRDDEAWFDVGGRRSRFSLREFAIITGLNCGNYPPGTERLEGRSRSTRTRLGDKYFKGLTLIPTTGLKHQLLMCEDEEDTYRLSLVYFLHAVLLSRDWRQSIVKYFLSLVDDLESFDKFPWGRVSYERTIRSLKRPMRLPKSKHKVSKLCLHGFPFAFLVWVYEVVPFLGRYYARKKTNAKYITPRILRWEGSLQVSCKNLSRNFLDPTELNAAKNLRASKFEKEQDYVQSIGRSNHTLDIEDGDSDETTHTQDQSDADSSDDLSSGFDSETFKSCSGEVKLKMKKLKHIEDRNFDGKRSEVVANISWLIRSKGKRKSRKRRTMSGYVPFCSTEPQIEQKTVSLSPTRRMDVKEMELLDCLNESRKLNNCLETLVFRPLGRDSTSMVSGDGCTVSLETERQCTGVANEPDPGAKLYDLDAFVCDRLLNKSHSFSKDFLEQLDVVIQHELDLNLSGG